MQTRFPLLPFLAFFAPWAAYISLTSLNSDTLWLAEAASRMLDGQRITEAYYDNNPPLSFLIYAPAALLDKWLPLTLGAALHITMALLIAASVYASHFLLRQIECLTEIQRWTILTAYAAAITILPSLSYAEREHILMLGLFPLTLMQIARTWGWRPPRVLFAAIAISGAIAVLIKPPFLLIPALLQLHRAAAQKRPIALFDAETWWIGGATSVYAIFVYVFFPDYVTGILPEFARLYITNPNTGIMLEQLVEYSLMIAVFLGVEASVGALKGRAKSFLLILYGLSLACMIPFALQGKGYYYHLIPAIGFFFCAFALSAEGYAEQYARLSGRRWKILAFMAVIAGLAYAARPPLLSYPTAAGYARLPMAAALREACGPGPCGVYILNDTMETVPQTEYYGGFSHATRFPSLWFLPPLENEPSRLPEEEREKLRGKYIGLIADDFAFYKPQVLLLKQGIRFREGEDFDFIRYFSQSPAFATLIKSYEKTGTITFDRSVYYKGTALDRPETVHYDIYKRIR